MTPLLVAVMGPTASGKSDLAESLASALDAVLLNADAFQVYRGLDIGTAKPTERERYRLIDIKSPSEPFGVGEWALLAQRELEALFASRRHVVVVGGTGLNVRALFEQYATMGSPPDSDLRRELTETPLQVLVARLATLDPDAYARVDLRNPARVRRAVERALNPGEPIELRLPPYKKIKFALDRDPLELEARIARRVQSMVQNGWVKEVAGLRESGVSFDDPGMRAIGYRTLWRHLDGEIELGEAVATTIVDTRRYAKRQRTWLRTEPNLTTLDAIDPLADARDRLLVLGDDI